VQVRRRLRARLLGLLAVQAQVRLSVLLPPVRVPHVGFATYVRFGNLCGRRLGFLSGAVLRMRPSESAV